MLCLILFLWIDSYSRGRDFEKDSETGSERNQKTDFEGDYNPDSELFEDTLPRVWEVLGSECLRTGRKEKNFKSGYESIHKKVNFRLIWRKEISTTGRGISEKARKILTQIIFLSWIYLY